MEKKPTAVIEITTSQIKLVIGRYIPELGKVSVLYTKTKHIENIIESTGKIVDFNGLINALKEFSFIKDEDLMLKLKITEIVLVLPSIGMQTFFGDKTVNTLAETVDKKDISNLVSLTHIEPVAANNIIVDIIPYEFCIDGQNRVYEPPLGVPARNLRAFMSAYTLGLKDCESYRNAAIKAGFKIKRTIIAPCAAAEYIYSHKEYIDIARNGYIYVDIGQNITTVSLIKDFYVVMSSFILKGGNNISNDIAMNFRITLDEADKLKCKYGLSTEFKSFNPVIIKKQVDQGTIDFTLNQLNNIVKMNLDDFVFDLKTCINSMLKGYKESVKNRPLLISGGGSKLNELHSILKESLPNQQDIIMLVPDSIGAREPMFTNSLGAIVANGIYRGSYQDDGVNRVQHIERETQTDKNIPEEGKEQL